MSTEETIAQQVVDLVNSNSEEIVEAVTETVKETVAEVIKETSTASTVSDIALNKYAELLVSIDPYFKKVSDTLNTIPYFKQVSDTLNSMPGKYLYAIDKLKLTPAYKWLFTKIPFPNFTVPEWYELAYMYIIINIMCLFVTPINLFYL